MRLDITVRQLDEIPGLLKMIRDCKIKAVDITNLYKEMDPVEVARQLKEAIPALDIALYLSAKHFVDGSIEAAKAQFRKRFEEAKKLGVKKFLFVSGHPRGPFDVLEMLQIVNELHLVNGCEIYCMYNPYFDPGRLREEQERLRAKLAFPLVSGVVFQVGMDTEKLKKGVEQVRSLRPEVSLFGAIPLPSAQTLEQLRLNLIYGVFLPNSYLLNEEMSTEMTASLMDVFKSLKIEPIVFTADTECAPAAFGVFK